MKVDLFLFRHDLKRLLTGSAGLFLKSLFWVEKTLSGQFYDYYRLQPISPASLQNEKVISELLITLPKKGRNFSIMNFILAQGNANLLCFVPIVETRGYRDWETDRKNVV